MPRGGHNSIPQATLVESLRTLADELGRSPSQADINEHSPHSHKTYYRKFDDGLAEAKERAGLTPNSQHGGHSVTVDCGNCGAGLERPESDAEANEYCYCDQVCHYEHKRERCRGENNPVWNSVSVECNHCGESFTKQQWDAERYDKHFCSDCWGNIKIEIECEWCGQVRTAAPSRVKGEKTFCSQKCHGRWISENNTGENHPRWRPGQRPEYYGPNWLKQRRAALMRDQHRCQDCGVTHPTHREEVGEGLSVHHIKPFRQFETADGWNYEDANQLRNLISLCRSCHMQRENSLD